MSSDVSFPRDNERRGGDVAARYSEEARALFARERLLDTAKNMVDPLVEQARAMTDDALREAITSIRGNPKRAGSRARRLSIAETLALSALVDEEARRAGT